ncbi:protein-L-isoaspartate(D-aspartate) O-methyltransferase [Aliidiomarina haloalkalitolerans]|uniref:Protein-L-isoaspartate O-methyltransferase n=1 Tax=Aliidiomarina haloalkalitolerans TaxID=859059 RepID=A0A432VY02_9GAMM|nr:protein-L-isoaspartate(D-aspartate) O-methyltransferase [Aliidiomarina haloalkalitolerans]RUO21562.1 protein-L-isoaspartate O-methyltransferase [Aliidiomarina haloalkalitolerans]
MIVSNFQGVARKLAQKLQSVGISNEAVLNAIATTPRHEFMPESLAHQAYDNTALPIGKGQTISQPYMVAKMTELVLETTPQSVLEIGTGSGYQTSILAQLVTKVYSVERISSLQYQAQRRLKRLDLHNVQLRHGDGWQGWPSKAPFDAILVTAAAERIPEKLLEQLNPAGGRLIIPVGGQSQELLVVERQGEDYQQKSEGTVKFVPLIQGDLA